MTLTLTVIIILMQRVCRYSKETKQNSAVLLLQQVAATVQEAWRAASL